MTDSVTAKRVLTTLVALVLALAAVAAGLERLRRGQDGLDGAVWIWARDVDRADEPEPLAFYVAADFELPAVPETARLAIVADEAYHVWLGGWVGAGRYRRGGAVDVWEVAELLAPGRNRLVVELRSSRGAGGLLATLDVAGETVLVTGPEWRVYHASHPDLWRAEVPLPAGEPPRVWGPPPAGRWRPGPPSPPLPALTSPSRPYTMVLPARGLRAAPGGRWRRIPATYPFRLSSRLIGPATIFEWSEEVRGFPVLDLTDVESRPALLYRARSRRELHAARAELIVPVSGASYWQSVVGEPFRFLRIQGLSLERSPFALVVDPPSPSVPAAPGERGVFGLAPLWNPPRAERAVLQRLAEDGS